MADINWQRQTFSPINVGNPSVGFGAAAKAFGDIQKNISDKEAVDSLAAYRADQSRMAQEELDYKTGAEARAIAEEERKLAKSVEQGLLIEQLAKEGLQGAGESAKGDTLFGNMTSSNDPRMLELTGMSYGDQAGPIMPGALNAFDDFTAQSAQAMIPAAEYEKQLLSSLLKAGTMDYPTATAAAAAKTAEAYPTASPEEVKMRLDVLSKMPGFEGSGSGKGSYGKDATPGRTLDTEGLAGEIAEAKGLVKVPDTSFIKGLFTDDPRWDVGQLDAAQSDISHVIGRLQALGITDQEALRATVNEAFDPAYGNKIKDKYDWRTDDGIKELANYGSNQQAIQSRKVGGSAATAANAKAYGRAADEIFALGKTKRYSDDELFQAFLNDQGPAPQAAPSAGGQGGTPPPGTVVPPPEQQADATVDPAVMADAGDIMPAAALAEGGQINLGLNDIPGAPQTPEREGPRLVDDLTSLFNTVADPVRNANAAFNAKRAPAVNRVFENLNAGKGGKGLDRADLISALQTDLSTADRLKIEKLLRSRAGK